MKKGIYTASSIVEGSVMFRINGKPFTIRKGSPIEVEIEEKDNVIYSDTFMTLKFKGNNGLKPESKLKNTKKESKKVVKEEPKKVEPKKEEPKKEEPKKVEPKKEEPKKEAVKKTGTRRSVKIETEEK